jgi:hypothetical protein
MSVPEPTFEREAVERVAQEYREKGYEVITNPAASELPDFVREFPPDIIARSPKECVVIEVKNWVSAIERERLRAIARKVESRPGWRFVVVSPGGGDRSPGPSLQEAPNKGLINYRAGQDKGQQHTTSGAGRRQ